MGNVRRERLPGGDTNLFFDQVAPINFFRNRVFHLDPGVHFDEIKMPLLIDKKLDRAGIFVTDRFGQLHGNVPHFLAKPRRHER